MDDLYIISGNFEAVLVMRKKTMSVRLDLGDLAGIGLQHILIGEAHAHMGQYEAAEEEGRKALVVIQGKDYHYENAFGRWVLGMTLIADNRPDEATTLFQSSLETNQDTARYDGAGSSYAGLALAALKSGKNETAQEYLCHSLSYLLAYKHLFWMFYALATGCLLLIQQGAYLPAYRTYIKLSSYDFVANSKWFLDVFGLEIEKNAMTLSQEERLEAQKQAESLTPREIAQSLYELINNE